LSPEHPIVKNIISEECKKDVLEYIKKSSQKSDLERLTNVKEKTGVFTGSYAVNPANFAKIPIWVSDYVLMSYGTGAVMAVPGHDERDFAFAKKFNLEIKTVIKPTNGDHQDMYDGEGILINSGPFTNTESQIARDKISIFIGAKKKINYKLRD
jgi:leucyl-tRNA synthetase